MLVGSGVVPGYGMLVLWKMLRGLELLPGVTPLFREHGR